MSRAASKRKADSVEPLSAAVSASSSKAAPLQENERRMGDLNPFFTCRLCNGYFRDAMTISECLHTFCKICLHQHFQTDENQICGHCPICQCELGPDPMKGVRFNVALQSLFDKLLPQYAEEDLAFRNKLLASAAAQSSGAAASSSSASKGSDAAPPPISLPDASAAASSSSSSSSSSPSSAASVSAVTPSAALQAAGASKNILSLSTPHAREQITLELIPLPSVAPPKRARVSSRSAAAQSTAAAADSAPSSSSSSLMLPALAKPILRCSSKFTVFCLRKFVARKLAEAASAGAPSSSAASLSANVSADQIDILCGDEVLGGEHNLRFIKKTRWFEAARELELGYRLRL